MGLTDQAMAAYREMFRLKPAKHLRVPHARLRVLEETACWTR